MSGSDVKERLAVALTLTIAGKAHKVIAGSIKRLSLDLWSWGFEGEVEFLLTDTQGNKGKDTAALLKDFLKPELVEVGLEVKAVLPETSAQPSPTPLKLKGFVTDKTLSEEVITTGDSNLVIHRRYGVRFTDAARLLWRQHQPCVLYTQKTLKDVLEAHKGEKIQLTFDWAAVMEKTRPLIFVGLEAERGASFYDWVLWLVHSHVGSFSYDYTAQGYRIAAAKDASGTPQSLFALNLAELEVVFPEVIRHTVSVLNAVAEGPQTQDVAQQQSVTGIRQDVLLVTPIADEVQARVNLETSRLKVIRGPEVELSWRSFPEKALTPGTLVKLPANEAWAAAGVAKDKVLRVRNLHLSAEVTDEMGQDEVYGDPYALFVFQMSTRLEAKEELHVELPAWQPPAYPRYVEGLIVSEQGADEHETWQVYTDSATSQDGYKVKIPLYEDQIVAAPFNPNLLPGHFYFPAYKGERVLVALDLHRAWIKRFLDWRTGARMPQDGQGVQLLVGKTPENGTAIKHYYTDDKPVFLMQRTNDKDTQKLQIGEGNLLIEVKEEQ